MKSRSGSGVGKDKRHGKLEQRNSIFLQRRFNDDDDDDDDLLHESGLRFSRYITLIGQKKALGGGSGTNGPPNGQNCAFIIHKSHRLAQRERENERVRDREKTQPCRGGGMGCG
jgi:hypothetical protein